MTQLTITLDDSLFQAAQEYAHQHGQELNELVAGLLRTTMQSMAEEPVAAAAIEHRLRIVRELAGSVQLPKDFDYRREIEEALVKKHGL